MGTPAIPDTSATVQPFSELSPQYSAVLTTIPAQRWFIVALLLLFPLACCFLPPLQVANGLNEGILTFYALILVHRLFALGAGCLSRQHETLTAERLSANDPSGLSVPVPPPSLQEPEPVGLRGFPTYSILIPLFREASVVPQIVGAMERMQYPRSRLEVLLLLEEDDAETRLACEKMTFPAFIRPVIVPPGQPRTKPRACNYGLSVCTGELIVVFDAEDQPEIDQLMIAATALSSSDESDKSGESDKQVACVQARLAYYNPRQNLLTRWFAAEYMSWFELILPGLFAIGAPIPLGGTSNHFRTTVLRSVGGWDSWNVAEDCDLGVRLYRNGYRVRMIPSTTWEEACPEPGLWVRQRSRWIKGYLQTWLVHNRQPVRVLRELGPWQFLNMQLIVGGSVACLLLNPVYWFLTLLWWTHPMRWESALMGGPALMLGNISFIFGNAVFVAMAAAGPARRRQWDLAGYALLVPVYWIMMSIAAWKAILQILVAPHHWEKTSHGLVRTPPSDPLPQGRGA